MKSVSVIMATLNSETTLERCLKSIREQNYDQKKNEIVIADGGSKDKTLAIAEKYKAIVIHENTGSPESAKSLAFKKSKGEIILVNDSDAIIPDKNWLKKMVSYFSKEKNIVGVYTWRYAHNRNDKPLNRYFSLLGANDPVAWFLGKTDRQSYLDKKYRLFGKARDKGNYFLVKFSKNKIPTLGANGFLIKRKMLAKAKIDEKHFSHIDVNWDLINLGFNKYVVVKNDIIHASGESLTNFLRKRKKYMETLYLQNLQNRRYLIYERQRDRKKIIAYSLYSLSLIGPLIFSLKGFKKINDPAWFLHPVVCFLIFWIYFFSVINWQAWNYLGMLRKKLKI